MWKGCGPGLSVCLTPQAAGPGRETFRDPLWKAQGAGSPGPHFPHVHFLGRAGSCLEPPPSTGTPPWPLSPAWIFQILCGRQILPEEQHDRSSLRVLVKQTVKSPLAGSKHQTRGAVKDNA